MASRVVNGTIVPDMEHVKEIIQHLQTDLKQNKELAAEWKADPRTVLADRGLPYDMQTELLAETGHAAVAAKASCRLTCLCTKCCLTVHVVL